MRDKCSQSFNTSSAEDQIKASSFRRNHPVLALQQRSFEQVFSKRISKNMTDEVHPTVRKPNENIIANAGDVAEQLVRETGVSDSAVEIQHCENQSAADRSAINERQHKNQRPGVDGKSSTKALNGSNRPVYVRSRSRSITGGSSSDRSYSKTGSSRSASCCSQRSRSRRSNSRSRRSNSRSQRSNSRSRRSYSRLRRSNSTLPSVERLSVSKSTSGKREVSHSSSMRKSQSAIEKPAVNKSRQGTRHKESGMKANGMTRPNRIYCRMTVFDAKTFCFTFSVSSNTISAEVWQIGN